MFRRHWHRFYSSLIPGEKCHLLDRGDGLLIQSFIQGIRDVNVFGRSLRINDEGQQYKTLGMGLTRIVRIGWLHFWRLPSAASATARLYRFGSSLAGDQQGAADRLPWSTTAIRAWKPAPLRPREGSRTAATRDSRRQVAEPSRRRCSEWGWLTRRATSKSCCARSHPRPSRSPERDRRRLVPLPMHSRGSQPYQRMEPEYRCHTRPRFATASPAAQCAPFRGDHRGVPPPAGQSRIWLLATESPGEAHPRYGALAIEWLIRTRGPHERMPNGLDE